MQSVLEIATTPCADVAEAGEQLARAAPDGDRRAPRGSGLRSAPPPRTRSRSAPTRRSSTARATASWSTSSATSPCASSSSAPTSTSRSRAPTGRSTSPTGSAATCRCCSRCRPTRRSGRASTTGMMSSRVPVFRAFPREGIPPHYGTWEIYSNRVEMMIRAGAIEDYTYPVVGRAPAPEPRHGRGPDLRPADPGRAHGRARGAGRLARPPALRRSTTTTSRWSSTRRS